MAAIQVCRVRAEADVVRRAFAEIGIRHGDADRGPFTTYRAPGRVEIRRDLLDEVLPWARSQEMPAAWVRMAEGARTAGSVVVEHTRERLVIDDPGA